MNQFYANGKLLLTGEYFIIDGAQGIALPSQFGQSMEILPYQKGTIHWRSYDSEKNLWLELILEVPAWKIIYTNDDLAGSRLLDVLRIADQLSQIVSLENGYNIWTRLNFDRTWGLGSSSTLLSLVAQWMDIDAFELGKKTFGGSGYDIACATASGPIFYYLDNNTPKSKEIVFDPSYKDKLCFVHLGEKKDTQEALQHYSKFAVDNKKGIQQKIALINNRIIQSDDIDEFIDALDDHENIIANALQLQKIKDERFSDFNGTVKSLGAWGGDFILAASSKEIGRTITYFQAKGYHTILLWDDMVLSRKNSHE